MFPFDDVIIKINPWRYEIIDLPILNCAASLALGQFDDCPVGSAVTLKDMDKTLRELTKPKHENAWSLSGVPDYFGRNKISSGGDLSHYSSASLY